MSWHKFFKLSAFSFKKFAPENKFSAAKIAASQFKNLPRYFLAGNSNFVKSFFLLFAV